jgi:hypothetical protein
MKTTRHILLRSAVAALVFSAPLVVAADPSPFRNLEGSFRKGGRVEISGAGVAARGKCRLVLHITDNGRSARLSIRGELVVNGAKRGFRNVIVFRGNGISAISNLAPGLDDGHSVEDGSYRVSPRSINAAFPVSSGTTAGEATIFIRKKSSPRRRRLLVTQTLVTDALTSPITWKFQAAR